MMELKIGNIVAGSHPLIAVPLTDKEIFADIDASDADIIELRIDMFENIDTDYVKKIVVQVKEKFNKPIIATVRLESEGGRLHIDAEKRVELFKAIVDLVDAVDIEIRSDIFGKIVKLAHKEGKIAIGSFHDFLKTPTYDDMTAIIRQGRSHNADIVKIAVMPNSLEDLRTITELTLHHSNEGLISIAMGETGMASRIFLPMIGSLLTFASLDLTTAPGQMSLEKMKEFFTVIKKETLT